MTSYEVTYTVADNGLTHVSFNIDLTNTTTQYFASSYKVNVGFSEVLNAAAFDREGKIIPSLTKNEEGTTIQLNFNEKVAGLGKTLKYNLSFDTPNVAKKQGKIWEVNIPGISETGSFADFNVHVKVPESFGNATYIKPPQITNSLSFTKEQLGKSGISIAFGDNQIYTFKLKYHLKNSRILPVKTEIALPPTTNYQNVYIENISPKPLNVREDKDGNWLALYSLKPSQKMDVEVKGSVQILLRPQKEPVSEDNLAVYLKEKPYWEISDEKIKKLAEDLKTPAAIYEYVVNYLTYDFSRVTSGKQRLGAKNLLQDPTSAVCLEFTDLFVALARAAGIPSREIDGFAYTQNEKQRPVALLKDILHAWPEYYDRQLQTWIMVDPTWGNTTRKTDYFYTLDFDHFAFVIKGLDSEYPVPAGGYKLKGGENNKDVEVDFSDALPDIIQTSDIEAKFPQSVLSGLPIEGSVVIRNTGSSALPSQAITIETDSLFPRQQNILLQKIPPYGFVKKSFYFDKTPFLTNKSASIKITLGEKALYRSVKIAPFYGALWSLAGGILIAVIFTVILFIVATRVRRLPVFRPKQ